MNIRFNFIVIYLIIIYIYIYYILLNKCYLHLFITTVNNFILIHNLKH